MHLSSDESQDAVAIVHQTMTQTHYLLRAWLYSVLACGISWTIAFAVAQWQPLTPVWSASETMLVGLVCSSVFLQRRFAGVRSPPGAHGVSVQSRLPLFYGILYAFFLLWQVLFSLPSMQLAVLWVTVVMFATITTGLFLRQLLFIICGLTITVMAAFGYWVVPQYFWVWLAAFAGLPLIGISLYLLRKS